MRHVSECGKYMAIYLPDLNTLKIFLIDSKLLIHAYDVGDTIKQHLILPSSPLEIRVGKILWEHVIGNNDSTKLGVMVENFAMVIVYSLPTSPLESFSNLDPEPMIIQQDHADGIEDFFWIPAMENFYDHQEPGAYINSRQLLVYTKRYLQVRLYSLDCTHILWKLSKPVSKRPLINPQDRRLWSLVLESRSPTARDLNPLVYHFYNDGSTSNLLYRFSLPNILLSDGFELEWSQSGKWLIYFNCVDTLFGFTLQVFNVLGVNQRHEFNQQHIIPMGDPIININWLTDGFENDTSPITVGNLKYHLTSLSIDEITDYILVASTNDSYSQLELITTSIKDFRIINKETLEDFSGLVFYRQAFDGDNIYYTRTRSDIRNNSFDLKNMFVINQPNIKLLIIQFEESMLVNEILVNDESINKLVTYKPIQFILTDKIISIDRFNETDLLVLTSTHIFHYTLNQITVIYQNFPFISHSEFKFNDMVKLIIFPDNDDDDWVVKQIDRQEDNGVSSGTTTGPTVKPIISNNLISSPMKTEVLKLISRINQPRNLTASFTEENTDTFVNKRIRRS